MSAQWIVSIAVLVEIALFSGCRMAKLGKDYPDSHTVTGGSDASTSKAPIIQPQRQTQLGSVLSVKLDDSGKLLDQLIIRLDYFPAPRPDGVSVPTCYDEIAGHLVLGRIICQANGNIAAEIIANQVVQQCYTSTPVRKIAAKSPILLSGCKAAAEIQTYRYEPELKLEVVK
jgi:hypothetical protein